MKTYYKVVSVINKQLWSFNRWPEELKEDCPEAVRYVCNKWTYPNKGWFKLSVFKNRHNAMYFFGTYTKYGSMRVYECYVKKVSKRTPFHPEGTVRVGAVKILKRIG